MDSKDHSLKSGISIPQWMKSKNKFELDPSAFSPTELDDSFMLYYRKRAPETQTTQTTIIATNLPENITVAAVTKKKPDFPDFPTSCQKYVQNNQALTTPAHAHSENKIHSSNVDEVFKGEAGNSGGSIIKVASQMISNQGLGLRTCNEHVTGEETYQGRIRRNSKSLPASPLASPGSSPKVNRRTNKYFTGPFTDVDKSKGNWIWSNLLAKRDMSQSVDQIKEEIGDDLQRTSSTASVNDATSKTAPVYRARPSELREMNFWSPTSM